MILMIRRPPRSTRQVSSAASDVYKRQIGGGGSNSHLILEEVLKLIDSTCIIVIPLISLKSISKLESILKPKVHNLSISQHQSYRGVSIGEDIRLSPINPVFILKGEIK